jgi:ribosomal protein L16/L10AE
MTRHFRISFKSREKCYLVKTPLIAYIKLTKRFVNTHKFKYAFRSRILTFPDFALTSKPKSIRMGKGKGEISKFIYFLKIGNILSELRFKRNKLKLMKYCKLIKFKYNYIINKLIRKIKFKFPVKTHRSVRI